MSKLTEIQQQQELERRDARIADLERLIIQVKFNSFHNEIYILSEDNQDWWDKRCELIEQ